MGVWSERDLGQTVIQSKRKLNNAEKDGPLVKLLDGGMGKAMKKKIIRKKKIVEEIKGMLKKERKKKKHAG